MHSHQQSHGSSPYGHRVRIPVEGVAKGGFTLHVPTPKRAAGRAPRLGAKASCRRRQRVGARLSRSHRSIRWGASR